MPTVSSETYPYSRPNTRTRLVLPMPEGATNATTDPSEAATAPACSITRSPARDAIAARVTRVDNVELSAQSNRADTTSLDPSGLPGDGSPMRT